MQETHASFPLVDAIRTLISQHAYVQLTHVFREMNGRANRFAKEGHVQDVEFLVYDSLPSLISIQFNADRMGIKYQELFLFSVPWA